MTSMPFLFVILVITMYLLSVHIPLWWFFRKSRQELQSLINRTIKPKEKVEPSKEQHIKDLHHAWKLIIKNDKKEELTDEDELFFIYFCEQYGEDNG